MSLSKADKLDILRCMLESRLGDLREQSLVRQGKGVFHVSGMGHEALCAIGRLLRPDDYLSPYYRDRALVLSKGMTTHKLALEFFAKRESPSAGRQIGGHFSDHTNNIWSLPSPVAANLLPACGIAWGLKMDKKDSLVVASCGDAATRQGDFYEAGSFAKEMDLPMIFIVEDNGLGISSVTEKSTPKGLRLLKDSGWVFLDGCDVNQIAEAGQKAVEHVRGGNGPVFIWCRTERISSHSSADDHRRYRSPEELQALEGRCPIENLKRSLIEAGDLTEEAYQELHQEIEAQVRKNYQEAIEAEDPSPEYALEQRFGPQVSAPAVPLDLGKRARLVDSVNGIFRSALEKSEDYLFFGQDIADPKGGVFSLTKGLSTAFPGRVLNSPLAESTIVGVACGLASYGKRPVFEIQFIDFIWPAFNQLISNLATLRWRSNGGWTCPAVIYAPYGAYLPGGGVWHSQTNESIFAHIPGLQVVVPSTPEDAAGLFWTAMHAADPVLVLVPKHLLWRERDVPAPLDPIPLGKARIVREGGDVTIVAWGNTVEVAEEALAKVEGLVDVELIDLRSIQPWDKETIRESVIRTGRLVIVQEDGITCSMGQTIISTLCGDAEVFDRLQAPPELVAKPDVNIGFAANAEYGVLPSAEKVVEAIRKVQGGQRLRKPDADKQTSATAAGVSAGRIITNAYSNTEGDGDAQKRTALKKITIPMLGEGITNARLISLFKKPGETVSADEAICELETDKAVFPVESEFSGVLKEWRLEEDSDVEVGQELAIIEVEEVGPAPVVTQQRRPAPEPAAIVEDRRPTEGGLSSRIWGQMKNVVPTHMTVKSGWTAIRRAREVAKRTMEAAPSPTVMVAWCIVRAMEKHPIFCCTINHDDTLTNHENFDFGFAVSLENDALDTAVIPKARTLGFHEFLDAYNDALVNTRARKGSSKARTPLIITSMGGFSVRSALPVVVPPAIATLFIGEAHWEHGSDPSAVTEQVEMCLSFDHRWINGVAGAAFMSDVRREMEHFELPR